MPQRGILDGPFRRCVSIHISIALLISDILFLNVVNIFLDNIAAFLIYRRYCHKISMH